MDDIIFQDPNSDILKLSQKTMSEVSDQEHENFDELYNRFFKKVFAFAYRHTNDSAEAADLTQEVFLKLWVSHASFSKVIPPDAQLLTVARQLVINHYKREVVRQKVYQRWYEQKTEFSDSANSDQSLLTAELTDRFQSALRDLPPIDWSSVGYSATKSNKRINSLYAMASMGFRDAVFMEVTGRNDWSSTLPVSNRSYFYPSASLSVVVSDLLSLPESISFLN